MAPQQSQERVEAVTILTFRDPAFAGALRAELIPDDQAVEARSIAIAEFAGACDVWKVVHQIQVKHSRAVPHAQIPLDPEVILGDSRP